MAKLINNVYKEYELKTKKVLVLVVDMINGFCKEGTMADKDILQIVPNQISLLKKIQRNKRKELDNIIFIADSHKEDAKEFNAFPKHCLKGTVEEKVIDELLELFPTNLPKIVKKNSTNAFYSLQENTEVINSLSYYDYEKIIVIGCCTDICVMQLVLSLQTYINENNLTQEIIVPVDCVETYDSGNDYHKAENFNEMALTLIEQSGVKIVSQII